jgi:hypothetical protein
MADADADGDSDGTTAGGATLAPAVAGRPDEVTV